jgi:hypothetical protein
MKRSTRVTLTVAAAMAWAARAHAQDPCDPTSFRSNACKVAIKQGGFCSGGAWVSGPYQQPYPYYYDRYLDYFNQGGVTTPAPVEACGLFSSVRHGGFGALGVIHSAGG